WTIAAWTRVFRMVPESSAFSGTLTAGAHPAANSEASTKVSASGNLIIGVAPPGGMMMQHFHSIELDCQVDKIHDALRRPRSHRLRASGRHASSGRTIGP